MRSEFKLAAAALAVSLVGGCAAPLAPEAVGVREVPAAAAASCKFVRLIQVEGGLLYSSQAEARRDMLMKLRNETAKAGGNAFAARDVIVDKGFSLPSAQADAYICP